MGGAAGEEYTLEYDHIGSSSFIYYERYTREC